LPVQAPPLPEGLYSDDNGRLRVVNRRAFPEAGALLNGVRPGSTGTPRFVSLVHPAPVDVRVTANGAAGMERLSAAELNRINVSAAQFGTITTHRATRQTTDALAQIGAAEEARDDGSAFRFFNINATGNEWHKARIRNKILRIPTGYAYNLSANNVGLTLGELAQLLPPTLAQTQGLVIEGLFRVAKVTVGEDGGHDVGYSLNRLTYMPLSAIIPIRNRIGGSVDDVIQETASARNRDGNGSDVQSYFVVNVGGAGNACRIMRLTNHPAVVGNGIVRAFRTGGMAEMISTNREISRSFVYDGVRYDVIIPPGNSVCVLYCIYAYLVRTPSHATKLGLFSDESIYRFVHQEIGQRTMRQLANDMGIGEEKYYSIFTKGMSNKTFKLFQRACVAATNGGLLPVNCYEHHAPNSRYEGGVRVSIVRGGLSGESIGNEAHDYAVPLLRIHWDGSVYGSGRTKDGEKYISSRGGEVSGMLHSIVIVPKPPSDIFVSSSKWVDFRECIERETRIVMEGLVNVATGNVDAVDPVSLDAAVRYENVGVPGATTTIYSTSTAPLPETHDDDGVVAEDGGVPWYFETNKTRLIVAYDIETCTHEGGVEVVDPLYEAVNDVELLAEGPYESRLIGKQLPYAIGWCPVPGITDDTKFDSETHLEYHYEDGGGEVGKCVYDFVKNVEKYAVENGYKSVYLFAHNGAKFDSMVLITFNKWFKMTRLLNTGRGVLSMSWKTGGKHNLTFRFGDTCLLMGVSLKKAGEAFNFPASFRKIETFDIQHVTLNEYLDESRRQEACSNRWRDFKRYLEHDVRCLALLCYTINGLFTPTEEMISKLHIQRDSLELNKPVAERMNKPPLLQYCTNMAYVRRTIGTFMSGVLVKNGELLRGGGLPKAVSTEVIRRWITGALKGGSVVPGGRIGFYGGRKWFNEVFLSSVKRRECDGGLYVEKGVVGEGGGGGWINLDMTSLYPTTMRYLPMPTGTKVTFLNRDLCERQIEAIGCERCETLMRVCEEHEQTPRPFSVILVKNFKASDEAKQSSPITFTGRKLLFSKERNMLSAGGEGSGIVHSFEDSQEVRNRICGDDGKEDDLFGGVQSWTNVDLYMARRSGWTFDVICGFSWVTSFAFSAFVQTIFDLRASAKKEGNDVLQLLYKLILNGLYGIHAQKDVYDDSHVLTLPLELRFANEKENAFETFVRSKTRIVADRLVEHVPLANKQSILKTASNHLFGDVSTFNKQRSPNHIGAAVLSWSKYLMWLAFNKIGYENVIYTDTDSMIIPRSKLGVISSLLDPSGTKLGFFKNDYGEGEIIVFYVVGGKKVKLTVTVNEQTGKISIHPTCKGFLANGVDGRNETDRKCAHFIKDIGFHGMPSKEGYMGQKWLRDLSFGVQIADTQITPTDTAYLGYVKKFVYFNTEHGDEDSRAVFHGSQWTHHPSTSTEVEVNGCESGFEREKWDTLVGSNDNSALSNLIDTYYGQQ
jgi:hypothetical protein